MNTPKPPGDARGLRADARRNRARILAAAEQVFAEKGPSASTEEVAARAGVAVGTVFKHFPAKRDLLAAIMKDLLSRLSAEAGELAERADPATALFSFVTGIVEQAAGKRTVVALLAESGTAVGIADSVRLLGEEVGRLLTGAQRAGAVRADARPDEVLALLTALCQGALHAGWDADLRRRTLAVVFDGLRPR
ncbi:helix-turn-helix domain-containing protein [Streptosporangium sp. NPDC020072]|uniref:TetR/AcrR family transcriptional regulator n=1 Tax=Streptosporangium sp. NPDC020072 TaxID=3154788 RepID=UPI003424B6F4